MKVLLVTPSYYPNIGGMQYVVRSIAERLVACRVRQRPACSCTCSIEKRNYQS